MDEPSEVSVSPPDNILSILNSSPNIKLLESAEAIALNFSIEVIEEELDERALDELALDESEDELQSPLELFAA